MDQYGASAGRVTTAKDMVSTSERLPWPGIRESNPSLVPVDGLRPCRTKLKTGQQARIATAHFSSLPHNAGLRKRQYHAATTFLRQAGPSTTTQILMADFNAASPDEFSVVKRAGLVDAWDQRHQAILSAAVAAKMATDMKLSTALDAFIAKEVYRQLKELRSARQLQHQSTETEGKGRARRGQDPENDNDGHIAEAEFRNAQESTFGTLYPFLPHPAPRHRPRKARRIDRVYYKVPSALGGGGGGGGGEGITTTLSSSCSDSVVREYRLIGKDEPVRDQAGGANGRVLKCSHGAKGFEWPSDHAGVAVNLEWAR